MIPYNQLSLADIFSDCQEIYESDKPAFLSLLQEHIDLDEIVPASFRKHFYSPTGRTRLYPLNAFLWALIIQRIFSIPTDSLLLIFLHYSRHLREFCGFEKVPVRYYPAGNGPAGRQNAPASIYPERKTNHCIRLITDNAGFSLLSVRPFLHIFIIHGLIRCLS